MPAGSSPTVFCGKKLTLVETTSVITSRTLISADKVKGVNVYNLAGDKLGIDDIMIDRVAAATAGSSCIMTLAGRQSSSDGFHSRSGRCLVGWQSRRVVLGSARTGRHAVNAPVLSRSPTVVRLLFQRHHTGA